MINVFPCRVKSRTFVKCAIKPLLGAISWVRFDAIKTSLKLI